MADLTPNPDATPNNNGPHANGAGTVEPTESYVVSDGQAGPASATGPVAPVETGTSASGSQTGATQVIEPVAVETPTADPGTVAPVQGYAPAADTGPVTPQIVYVTAPTPPRIRSNRLAGVAIAALASLVFTIVLAVILAIVATTTVGFSFALLATPLFYVPVLLFVVSFILLALIVNRGGWWAYIIGSIIVAAVVYFGSIGVIVLIRGAATGDFGISPEEFATGLSSPVIIAAGLLAREVALWGGAVISRFGRRVKARNAEALATFEEEQRANSTSYADA